MAPVHLESTLALNVAQVPDAENDLKGGEIHLVTQLQADNSRYVSLWTHWLASVSSLV